jgi:polysaccharide deacetylase family protein (PEP-CTERM system associated)
MTENQRDSQRAAILNAFTVDVEDYYQVSAFADSVRPERWGEFESRVEANTLRLLEMLERFGTRGTFFILGWVAERFPALVRQIHSAGHELGVHSQWHRLVYDLTPRKFREDAEQSRKTIEDCVGESVGLYRAPSFSITGRSLWALEELVEAGFWLDSSIFPIRHDRYGIPNAHPWPHLYETPSGPIAEFPAAACQVGPARLPVSGGGYFRMLPYQLTRSCLRRINRKHRHAFMFYIHPWEVDPDQPRLKGSLKSQFRHYQNL